MRFFTSGLLLVILTTAAFGQQGADLIIVNARVHTMDAKRPLADAIAVTSGRIIGVGSNAEIERFKTNITQIIDAEDKLVIPGFNDAHVHFTGVGNWFSHLDASGIKSPQELLDRVAHFTRFLPKGRWVLGAKLTPEKAVPSLEELDAVSSKNPVLLYFTDFRLAFVNSVALNLAGIPVDGNSTPKGDVVRDATGRATGVVSGVALQRARNAIPQNNATNWAEIAEAASNYAASLGVTSVQDVQSDNLLATYHEMAQAGKLKTRIYECVGLADWEKDNSIAPTAATGDAMVRGGCLKWFSDGSAEERNKLGRRIAIADKAGLQVMVHAIGERSSKNTIDAFEFAGSRNGKRDRRFRIEHGRSIGDIDIARLSRLSIIASMQPALFYRGNAAGDDYAKIFSIGAKVAFGSDASMIDIDPLAGIYAAANSGAKSVSVETAVRAYTLGSAYAEFQEGEKGSISIGKLADIVILSRDIFAIPSAEIKNVRVITTIFDGKVVYEADQSAKVRPQYKS